MEDNRDLMQDNHANRTLTDEEMAELRMAQNQREWNDICDRIKAPDGVYPRDWFQRVMVSGLFAKIKTW